MNSDSRRLAALFIDFENLYYFLKNRLQSDHDPNDLIVRIVRGLKARLGEEHGADLIVAHAYADFERIQDGAQGALYLLGVETHNVLATEHKNAADMRLCIDVLETLYVRDRIGLFVVMAGDRDYIPVIQHLKKNAKAVLVVGFADNVSGDLVQIVGQERVLDMATLIGKDVRFSLKPAEAKSAMIDSALAAANGLPSPNGHESEIPLVPDRDDRTRIGEVQFARAKKITDPMELQAITFMLKTYGDKSEVWVGPLIHRFREEFPLLAEHERRILLADMEMHGAVKIVKRQGSNGQYSAMVVNWDHPNVREMYPGMAVAEMR